MVSGVAVAVVPDNLEAAEHLADGEEAEALGGDDAAGDERGLVQVAEALGDGRGLLGGGGGGGRGGLRGGGEEGAGVLGGVEGVLEIGLEGGDGAGGGGQRRGGGWRLAGVLTEEPCSGRGRRSWRPRRRPWSSRRR